MSNMCSSSCWLWPRQLFCPENVFKRYFSVLKMYWKCIFLFWNCIGNVFFCSENLFELYFSVLNHIWCLSSKRPAVIQKMLLVKIGCESLCFLLLLDEPVMIWRGCWDIPRGHVGVEGNKEGLCGRGGIWRVWGQLVSCRHVICYFLHIWAKSLLCNCQLGFFHANTCPWLHTIFASPLYFHDRIV